MSLPREGSRDTGDGILVSIYPDVCLTPCGASMIPVPYTIWAKQSDDANTTPTVRYTSLRTHNMSSLITACHGDEAGTGGGVKSGTHNGICEPMEHSATVRTEGKNAIRHNDIWWMNNKNTQGRLTYVKESDNTSLTPHSNQEWESLGGAEVNPLLARAQAPTVPAAAGALALTPALAGAGGGTLAAEGAGGLGLGAVLGGEMSVPVWGWIAAGATVVGVGGYLLYQRYKEKSQAGARTDANVNVSSQADKKEDDDCDKYRCGVPGSMYRGGDYGCTKGPGLHSHHMPAKANSPLPEEIGPAIQMDPEDHYKTASYGRSPTAPYMVMQQKLIEGGSFLGATAMDVADIHKKFGAKYDEAITQMWAYTMCLKRKGVIR